MFLDLLLLPGREIQQQARGAAHSSYGLLPQFSSGAAVYGAARFERDEVKLAPEYAYDRSKPGVPIHLDPLRRPVIRLNASPGFATNCGPDAPRLRFRFGVAGGICGEKFHFSNYRAI
jgi:hypothetical protein